jgi:hypothetical protein
VTTIDETLEPQAIDAEISVLGSMLLAPNAITEARRHLTGTEFYRDQHKTIYRAICNLIDAGKPADAVTVAAELGAAGQMALIGGHAYLHTLITETPTAVNVGYYAEQVKATWRRRELIKTAGRLIQSAQSPSDDESVLDMAARTALELDLMLDAKSADEPISGVHTWEGFLAQAPIERSWIVPGLIERMDVFMILAPPGAGKSWLSRQLCQTIAAGVHPFRPSVRIPPQRTLLIDFENPPGMVADQSRTPLSQVQHFGDQIGDLGHVWMRPEGLDLRKHADAQLLERVVAETRPAFIALGSLYKAFQRGRDDWDTAAEETRAVFDRLRARYHVAFWLEHHMPKANAGGSNSNPFGSSVWERWPGFGRVLRRVEKTQIFELAPTFRGDRDQREIPAGLIRGGRLPWSPIYDEAELELAIQAAGGKR